MKTTLDLPEELVREMKVRAAREGRKLRDVATEVVRRGLEQPDPPRKPGNRVKLPLFEGKPPANPEDELTPERIHDLLAQQEVEWMREADEAARR
ncbi:antitoxin [Haloferula sp. A504]|uniref:antitoxin n=1 Tax=Haloferula sp. A504 TaxID=3373601 RepID=UPI0031C68B53|nr:hypothetical protein [Verrucomicrobiaceae bacterium E54]